MIVPFSCITYYLNSIFYLYSTKKNPICNYFKYAEKAPGTPRGSPRIRAFCFWQTACRSIRRTSTGPFRERAASTRSWFLRKHGNILYTETFTWETDWHGIYRLHATHLKRCKRKASPKRCSIAVINQTVVLNIPCLLQYAYITPCPFFLNRTDIPCSGYSFTRSRASDVT